MNTIFKFLTPTILTALLTGSALSAQPRTAPTAATSTESKKEDKASNGKSLWFEGYGLYGVIPFSGAWDTDPSINGSAINQPTAATTQTFVPGQSNKGFGGGLNVGYAFVSGLSGVLGFQISGQSSSRSELRSDNGGTFDVTRTTKTSFTAVTLNLGLRPQKNWGDFSIYGGGGMLLLMPMTVTTDEQTPGETVNGARTSRLTTDKYNLALGAYGEVGVKYNIGAVALGAGLRLNLVSTSNNGKTREQTDVRVGNANRTTTTTIQDSFSAAQRAAEQAKSSGNTNYDLTSPTTILLTNWQIILGASYTLNL